MRKRFIQLTGLSLVFTVLAACSHRSGSGEESEKETSAVAEVTLVRVERADIRQTLVLTGTIAAVPNRDVRISALVAGRVADLRVAEGDSVRDSELVAKLDDRPFRDQLEQAAAAVAQATASLENARLSLARHENLVTRGIAARKELEDARMQASVAEATLRQAEAAQSLARRQLERTEIRSPIAGMVVKRFVSVGEQVDGTAVQPILEVADRSEVEWLASVPAAQLGKFREGKSLEILTDAAPGGPLAGRVLAVSPAVDSSTNMGLTRIRMSNREGFLRLGMFLTARVPVETHAGALVLPPQAIYRDAKGQPRVFHVDGERAKAVEVTLGIETPERVEILSGVQAGETVILTGGYGLGETSKIRVKAAAPR